MHNGGNGNQSGNPAGLTVRQVCTVIFPDLPPLDAAALQATLRQTGAPVRVEWGQGALTGAPVTAGVAHLGGHRVVMLALQAPVQRDVLERTVAVSPMPDDARAEMMAHRTAIRLLYVDGAEEPLEQLTALYLVAGALLAQGGLGILNERATLALPFELAVQHLPQIGAEQPPIQLWVGVVTFNVDEGLALASPRYLMRTYGMKQMGLVDLAYLMRERTQADDAYHVLMNLCLHIVEQGSASPVTEGDRVDFAGRSFLLAEPGGDLRDLEGDSKMLLVMEI